MDRFINTNGNSDGSDGTCACFRGTCTICAPHIKTSETQKGKVSPTKRNKKGETKND